MVVNRLLPALSRVKRIELKPKRSDVLIYSSFGAEFLSELLGSAESLVLDVYLRRLYLQPALSAFWLSLTGRSRGFGLTFDYTCAVIEATKPRVLITFMDESEEFWRFKKIFPHVRTVMIQNGRRFVTGDVFGRIPVSPDLEVDHMFLFSSTVGEQYGKFIRGQVHPHGSMKLNKAAQEINFASEKNDDVLYISGFEALNDFAPRFINGDTVSYDAYFEADKLHLKQLARWCNRKGLALTIAGRSNGDDSQERVWFDEILGADCKWRFQSKTSVLGTYELAARHKLVTTCDSTLGYELIAVGCKVLFHSLRGTLLKESSYDFGWPAELPDCGPAWYGGTNAIELESLLDSVWEMNPKRYIELMNPYVPLVMNLDAGNTDLSSTLRAILL